ncbi:MAG: bifunctional (p)ppGpp synthetase/guanosine-3',5'-bis(diphosphate) 3'-pyrophosphohydrolase [Lautropia sp.]|nr:bifunctional (p)ppGpp synthetase/guanosine-3',5'-bis(diphosphate) 3'-pyrophosphohydrolase [Lautropia sp.]
MPSTAPSTSSADAQAAGPVPTGGSADVRVAPTALAEPRAAGPNVAKGLLVPAADVPLAGVEGTDAPLSDRVSIEPLLAECRTYLPETDLERIRNAFRLAEQAHSGQARSSGEPYITHPISVALICASWQLDGDAICAALMHDVLEDTPVSQAELTQFFGRAVAEMIDGLSKLDKMEFGNRETAQAESFRKMLLAMARDVRVILVKLADRLHNMRTLEGLSRHRQVRIANETAEIYAPIANRLGLHNLFRELQDLAFRYQHPMRHRTLARAIQVAARTRRDAFGRVTHTIEKALARMGVQAEISAREKSLYSIYRKMVDKRISFSEVYDLFGVRLIVPDLASCYLALGAVHSVFKPNTSRFKDFIAIPKKNGYQSLHTTVVGPHGGGIEFQIRTPQMHQVAEVGVAAHWLYKTEPESSNQQIQTLDWLKSLLDIQQQTGDSLEFIDHVKVDLYPDAVYVFTPKGQIRGLPRGATVIDFAYSVHTDLGNQCVAARINGDPVPLRTELTHGDIVEVIADPNARPSPSWLAFARTGKARAEIRHFLRRMKYDESVELGRRLLMQSLGSLRINIQDLSEAQLDKAARDTGAKSATDLYADIGLGLKLAPVVARAISLDISGGSNAATATLAPRTAPIVIQSIDGISLQAANCCHPVPGDRIIGQMRGGHGLSIHRLECETARRQISRDAERWIDVEWGEEVSGMFRCILEISADDERGILGRIASEITASDADILQVAMDTESELVAAIRFTLQVQDRDHLAEVFRRLRKLPQMRSINRS